MALNKRIKNARSLIEDGKLYSLDEALGAIVEYSSSFQAKFDETVEVVMKLGVDPRHSDQLVRGAVAMPHGLGKKVRVAVFVREERHEEARNAGADIVGAEDLIDRVKSGEIDFDICIATPEFMPKIAVLGKILGTKGLMPNPKLGTVAEDIVTAIKRVKMGQVEYKVEKAGLIHAGIGKVSFGVSDIKGNVVALYNAVMAAKPAAAKGVYMQKMYLSTTHGPSIELDVKSLIA